MREVWAIAQTKDSDRSATARLESEGRSQTTALEARSQADVGSSTL